MDAKMPARTPLYVTTALAAILSVPATYAILRTYEVIFKTEPNPALIVWSAHIAMFWRLAVCGYVAGLLAPLAYAAARRDLARTIRTLGVLAWIVIGLIGVQGLFLP